MAEADNVLLLELLASVALLIWVAFYPRLKPSAGDKQRQKPKQARQWSSASGKPSQPQCSHRKTCGG